MDILKIARILDVNGNYQLADKLDKYAQQGVMNLDRAFQGTEQYLVKWLKDMTTLLPPEPGDVYQVPHYEFDQVEIPPFLKNYISRIDHNLPEGALGAFEPSTKTLKLPLRVPENQYKNLLSTVLHEIRHSIDPRYNNSSLMKNYRQQYNLPRFVSNKMLEILKSTAKFPSYEDFISKIILDMGGDLNNSHMVEMTKKNWPESIYNTALSAISKQKNLYFNNPIEHSSQLGDIKALLSKENLDKVREFIKNNQKENLSDLQIRLLLKNGLNPNNRNFEAFSNILQQVSGNQGSSLSQIVKSTQDPKWQEQYLKQVSNAVSVYNSDGNRFKGLVRKENLLKGNPNAAKNLSAFFSKAAQIEALAEQNPGAWNKFINSNFATRMISTKLYNLFKGIGSGSKSLSQTIKGIDMNSPYWQLLEPAIEFALYQFGLFLENPKAYKFETDESSSIKQLNARINEIVADNKIGDKRKYFIEHYGSYLKQLGTIEQNQLLSRFPVMPYNQFMNIGKNIGQK